MPHPLAQDVANIIARNVEDRLERFEGSGIMLTPAQKNALASLLRGGQCTSFDLNGNKISLRDSEWCCSAENVGKRFIKVVAYDCQCKLGPRSERYTQFTFSLVVRLHSWKFHPESNEPYEASHGFVFHKSISAKDEEVSADARCEVLDCFIRSKWTICEKCDNGATEDGTIGKVCRECYFLSCIGSAIKRRRHD